MKGREGKDKYEMWFKPESRGASLSTSPMLRYTMRNGRISSGYVEYVQDIQPY